MAAAVAGMRAADPTGTSIALFLLAAFAPLRPPRPVLAAVTLLGVLAFNVLQFSSGHSALSLILATDAGAAFFFWSAPCSRQEAGSHHPPGPRTRGQQGSRPAASAAAERGRMAREMHDVLAHTLSGLALHLEGVRLLALTPMRIPACWTLLSRPSSSPAPVWPKRAALCRLSTGGKRIPGPELIGSLVDQHRLTATGTTTYHVDGQPVPLAPRRQR